MSRLLALRVVFKRAVFSHILDAANLHHSGNPAQIIINCPGLSARFLGGVMDKAMVPARGQTVLVRNVAPFQGAISGSDDKDDEVTYLMTRAVAGGTILGGCYQKGNWDGAVDVKLAERILKRALNFCPDLVKNGPLDIISHNVGLRPVREGGIRVEREVITGKGSSQQVVHNYGHGGAGYQTSYGCALRVVALVGETVENLERQVGKAKL
jgi:D-amino-acid oxidase